MSTLEENVAKHLEQYGVPFEYESKKIGYTVPEREATYTPDFHLPNGIIVECKGLFEVDDRQKHILIKAQHPELDIRFVFQNPSKTIYKGSPTTYAKWCDKHGFKYAAKVIPKEWLDEKP